MERIINHEMTVWQQNQRRNAFVAPRLHNIDTLLSEIAQNELQRIENKVDEKTFGLIQSLTHRLKKKVLAAHVEHADQAFLRELS